MKYLFIARWHHVKCFVEKREELEFFASGEDLSGFNTLSADDKEMLRSELKATAPKKRKAEETPTADWPDAKKSKVDEKEIKKQNIKMFYYRDLLQVRNKFLGSDSKLQKLIFPSKLPFVHRIHSCWKYC